MIGLEKYTLRELAELERTMAMAVATNDSSTLVGKVQQFRLERALDAYQREIAYRRLLVVPSDQYEGVSA